MELEISANTLYFFRENSDNMTTPAKPTLEPGRVYRMRDFATWSANPPRLASRLVREGQLVQLAHGLFVHPKQSRFGVVPPSDEALMRISRRRTLRFHGAGALERAGARNDGRLCAPPRLQHETLGSFRLQRALVFAATRSLPSKPTARVVRRGSFRERGAGRSQSRGSRGRIASGVRGRPI